ncbi:cytochrome P450 [Xylariales sp. AK1849]|nr:cytochrome P450 [Xylariales sp. AK1849]
MAPLADFLPNLSSYPELVVIGLVLLLACAVYQTFFAIHYPSNLPLVGEPAGRRWFSLRTRWRYLTDCPSLYREAYEKFTKKGKTVLIPGFGVRHEIIMPQSAMRWVLAQPENALSLPDAFVEVDQVKYSLGHERYVADGWQGLLVKTDINAVLEKICATMKNELGVAFDKHFGTNSDSWDEIDLLQTVRMVVAQAASRFTVGLPLCRNEEYLTESFKVVDALVLNAGLTGSSPRILRPVIGRLVSWNIPGYIDKIKKHFQPVYQERLEYLEYDRNNPDHLEPQDHLQMMLRFAQKERPDELHNFDIMTKRLCAVNFASMHQTSLQATNMLLNIIGSDPEFNTISVLRDEVNRVIGMEDDKWSKAKVARMYRSDSVARETLRLHSFGNRAVFRKVMVEGIVTEDGIRLPKGALTSFMGYPAQSDAEKFDDALKYDPFRFSRAREASADAEGKPGLNNLSFVSTSPQHLPFGHGNHACPGRFLIDFELKMIIAYIVTNYDVNFPPEYEGKRPPNVWMTEANFPPPKVKIRIKRRENNAK